MYVHKTSIIINSPNTPRPTRYRPKARTTEQTRMPFSLRHLCSAQLSTAH